METARTTINRVLNGDPEAFRLIINDYKRLVFHVVSKLVDNPSDREELCQEVFVKTYQHLKSFRDESKFSTWIAKIAHHTSINFLQKRKIALYDDMSPSDDGDTSLLDHYRTDIETPDETAIHHDRTRILQSAISSLPGNYQTILTLYHVEQMSYLEIAEIMNMPEGTVKNYLFRARQKLKDILLARFAGEAVHL